MTPAEIVEEGGELVIVRFIRLRWRGEVASHAPASRHAARVEADNVEAFAEGGQSRGLSHADDEVDARDAGAAGVANQYADPFGWLRRTGANHGDVHCLARGPIVVDRHAQRAAVERRSLLARRECKAPELETVELRFMRIAGLPHGVLDASAHRVVTSRSHDRQCQHRGGAAAQFYL